MLGFLHCISYAYVKFIVSLLRIFFSVRFSSFLVFLNKLLRNRQGIEIFIGKYLKIHSLYVMFPYVKFVLSCHREFFRSHIPIISFCFLRLMNS